jgi:NDP-sugar pyrophosphorylase family protein
VLEAVDGKVLNFKEKPTYTYYSNGGIYLIKKTVLDLLPFGQFFNATDLMEEMIKLKMKVYSYPLIGYWLDMGTPSDFERAQQDILKIKF